MPGPSSDPQPGPSGLKMGFQGLLVPKLCRPPSEERKHVSSRRQRQVTRTLRASFQGTVGASPGGDSGESFEMTPGMPVQRVSRLFYGDLQIKSSVLCL